MHLSYFVYCVFSVAISLERFQVCAGHKNLLLENLLSHYNKQIIPGGDVRGPVNVTHSISVQRIVHLGDDKILHLDVVMSMFWADERLQWTPEDFGGLQMVRLPSNQIWVPDIILKNNADVPTPLPEMIKAVVTYDGRVFYTCPMKVRSYCDGMTGCHVRRKSRVSCDLKYASWVYDGLMLDLKPQDGGDGETHLVDFNEEFNDDWHLESFRAARNQRYFECCNEPYIDITYTAVLVRH